MANSFSKSDYLSIRKDYNEFELQVSGRYDKWILTLSGGALGLSITFLDKIVKNPLPDTLIWLKFSWTLFVLSLLAALLSLVTSQSAIRENRNELDKSFSGDQELNLETPRWFTIFTNILNWSSLFLFVSGVMFLCFFSLTNIDQKQLKEGTNNVTKTSSTSNFVTSKSSSSATRWIKRICSS